MVGGRGVGEAVGEGLGEVEVRTTGVGGALDPVTAGGGGGIPGEVDGGRSSSRGEPGGCHRSGLAGRGHLVEDGGVQLGVVHRAHDEGAEDG